MDYEGAYSQKLTQDYDCTTLLYIWENFKPLQDEWIMKGPHSQKLTQDLCTPLLHIWDNFKPP